jgi:predicted transcriptional regulator
LDKVILFNDALPQIGLMTRKLTEGIELELVEKFIDFKISEFGKNRKRMCLAVFCEPQIESGYPDVVFAEYLPTVFEKWTDARFFLTNNDLKVLQHIIACDGTEAMTLIRQLGIDAKSLLLTLEKLLDAKMIKREAKTWKAYDINKIFGIKKLIAVEAKIKNWSAVLQQALLNKWFASESYALSKLSKKPTKRVIDLFENNGIGMYIFNGAFKKINNSQILQLPSCYRSFMFNEWIGRRLNKNLIN